MISCDEEAREVAAAAAADWMGATSIPHHRFVQRYPNPGPAGRNPEHAKIRHAVLPVAFLIDIWEHLAQASQPGTQRR